PPSPRDLWRHPGAARRPPAAGLLRREALSAPVLYTAAQDIAGGSMSGTVSSTPAFQEMLGPEGVLAKYALVQRWLLDTPAEALALKRREAELLFRRIGITFAVYSAGGDPERLIPFDIIPRVLDAAEWDLLSRGLRQRVRALNAFLHDVYHERAFIRSGAIP